MQLGYDENVEIFLTPDGYQKLFLRGASLIVASRPKLLSIEPNWVAAPQPGLEFTLQGSELDMISSVFILSNQGPLAVPYASRSPTSASFNWPSDFDSDRAN